MFLGVYSQLIKKLSEMVSKDTETSRYPITSENTVFSLLNLIVYYLQKQIAGIKSTPVNFS